MNLKEIAELTDLEIEEKSKNQYKKTRIKTAVKAFSGGTGDLGIVDLSNLLAGYAEIEERNKLEMMRLMAQIHLDK